MGRNFKKMGLSVLIILAMLSCGFSSLAYPASSVQITVSSPQASIGSNVTVSVAINSNSRLGAATMTLSYDTGKLQIVNTQNGAAAESGMSDINTDKTGEITLAYMNEDGLTVAGSLLDVTFKIVSTIGGDIPLTLQVAEFIDASSNYADIAFSITQGKVKALESLASIALSKTATTIPKGMTDTLSILFTPSTTTDDKTATWTSSNHDVATVDSNGVVTARGAGESDIRADVGGKTAVCKVTVTVPMTGIEINKSVSALIKGQTDTLSITFTPTDTTEDRAIAWSSDDTNIASISDGVVTAKKAGTATITATSASGLLKKTCSITVTEIALNSIAINKSQTTIQKSRNETLHVLLNPADTTDDIGTTVWETSDASVATVLNGLVTAIKPGTATIKATLNGKTATCSITVTVPVITIDIYTTEPTKNDISVSASSINGTLAVTTHTFTENGSFEFIATDESGNTTRQIVTITNIDKKAPVITIRDNSNNKTLSDNGWVPLGNNIKVSIDDGIFTLTRDGQAYNVPEGGIINIEGVYVVNALDSLGNLSKMTFMIAKMADAASKTDPITTVKMDYGNLVIPDNVVLSVVAVPLSQITTANFVMTTGENITTAFDISILSNGIEIQPNGKVRISIPIPVSEAGKSIRILHMKDDGTVEELVATIQNGMAVFETTSFSSFVLITKTLTSAPNTSDPVMNMILMCLLLAASFLTIFFNPTRRQNVFQTFVQEEQL